MGQLAVAAVDVRSGGQQPLFDWRDKSVVQLGAEGSSGIDEIEIVRGSEKVILKKIEMDWQLSDGRKTQQGKVPGMLGSLEGARAAQIIDKPAGLASYGLDKPRLTVTLRKAGKDVGSVSFGRDNASPDGVYAKGTAAAVMTVGKELYDTFNVQLSDVLETQSSPAIPAK